MPYDDGPAPAPRTPASNNNSASKVPMNNRVLIGSTGEATPPAAGENPALWPKMPAKVAAAVSAIMAEVGAVGKTGNNSHFNYRFMEAGELDAALQPLLAKHKLVVFQSELVIREFMGSLMVTYGFGLVCEDETWDFQIRRTGMAGLYSKYGQIDDKAVNKCDTAAAKYFYKDLFRIPTLDVKDQRLSDGDADGDGVVGGQDDRGGQQQGGGAQGERRSVPPTRYAHIANGNEIVMQDGGAWREQWFTLLRGWRDNGKRDAAAFAWADNDATLLEVAKTDPASVNEVMVGIRDVVGIRPDVKVEDWTFPLLRRDASLVGVRGARAWLDAWRRTVDEIYGTDGINGLGLWRSEMETKLKAIAQQTETIAGHAVQYYESVRSRAQQGAEQQSG